MRVAVITISDSVSQGKSEDRSGPAVAGRCKDLGWEVVSAHVVADDRIGIEKLLTAQADSGAVNLVVTTGGTGIGPRDTTPEATAAVCSRLIPGFAELMRSTGLQVTRRAVMSRAVVGVRSQSIIVNLPGSPKGAVESLDAIADLLPHACDVIRGLHHG
jgi:molybdenum cofactor synthesis domain-containing protein